MDYLCLFCLALIVSQISAKNEVHARYEYICSKHGSDYFLYDVKVSNDGCLVECVLLLSSSKVYISFYDQTVVQNITIDGIPCKGGFHVCFDGQCIVNPLQHRSLFTPRAGQPANGSKAAQEGLVSVEINSAETNWSDTFSRPDLYVVLKVNGREEGRTATVQNSYGAYFGTTFNLGEINRYDEITFEIKDEDEFDEMDDIGYVTITANEIIGQGMNGKTCERFVSYKSRYSVTLTFALSWSQLSDK